MSGAPVRYETTAAVFATHLRVEIRVAMPLAAGSWRGAEGET